MDMEFIGTIGKALLDFMANWGWSFWVLLIVFAVCDWGAWKLYKNMKRAPLSVIPATLLSCVSIVLAIGFVLTLAYYTQCPGGYKSVGWGGGSSCVAESAWDKKQGRKKIESEQRRANEDYNPWLKQYPQYREQYEKQYR
jgi:hypothetical protein